MRTGSLLSSHQTMPAGHRIEITRGVLRLELFRLLSHRISFIYQKKACKQQENDKSIEPSRKHVLKRRTKRELNFPNPPPFSQSSFLSCIAY